MCDNPVTSGSLLQLTATTTTGESIVLSTSDAAGFGFPAGSLVHFTKSRFNGKVAVVRGVADGMLWFSVFPDEATARDEASLRVAPVQTTSCRGREEYIRQYGWMLV